MWGGVGPIPRPPYLASPPAPRRWVWIGIGAGSMLALGVVGMTIVGIMAFLVGDIDGDSFEEDDYLVDQSRVEKAVDEPCVQMKDAAGDLVLMGPPTASAASLKAFTASAGEIVQAIDGAKPDGDSKAWRDDWITLAASLDAYAVKVAAGDPAPYKMPRSSSSGFITERMYYGSPEGCEVPTRVDMLDPRVAEDYDSIY